MEWDKIFANDVTEKESTSEIYNSISKKQTTQLKNGQKTYIAFFQRRHTDGQQYKSKPQ